jgi:hypothetical protein
MQTVQVGSTITGVPLYTTRPTTTITKVEQPVQVAQAPAITPSIIQPSVPLYQTQPVQVVQTPTFTPTITAPTFQTQTTLQTVQVGNTATGVPLYTSRPTTTITQVTPTVPLYTSRPVTVTPVKPTLPVVAPPPYAPQVGPPAPIPSSSYPIGSSTAGLVQTGIQVVTSPTGPQQVIPLYSSAAGVNRAIPAQPTYPTSLPTQSVVPLYSSRPLVTNTQPLSSGVALSSSQDNSAALNNLVNAVNQLANSNRNLQNSGAIDQLVNLANSISVNSASSQPVAQQQPVQQNSLAYGQTYSSNLQVAASTPGVVPTVPLYATRPAITRPAITTPFVSSPLPLYTSAPAFTSNLVGGVPLYANRPAYLGGGGL